MSEIEFLPPDDGDPPPSPPPSSPRRECWRATRLSRRATILALAALLAIGGAAWTVAAALHHDDATTRITTDLRPLSGPGRSCYGAPACTVTARLPAAVTDAVRAHLGVLDPTFAGASSEVIPAVPGFAPMLAARVFSLRLSGGLLTVDITPHVDSTSVFTKIAATTSVTGVVDGYAVRIDYRPDRPGPVPPRIAAALQALAVDRRLEAV